MTSDQLPPGGLLFLYGSPHDLIQPAIELSRRLTFKYWIALDIADAPPGETLIPSHVGLVMFHKLGAPFRLNNAIVRLPHAHCPACGKTLKDWGGKKHLMNPAGTNLSDVWRDLPRRQISDRNIPQDVLDRIHALATENVSLHVAQSGCHSARSEIAAGRRSCDGESLEARRFASGDKLGVNQILHTDCLTYLDTVPPGGFALCFADPPYNLAKLYSGYDDAQAEHEYLTWCDRWLAGMARALKPGGSLFVLNLPKWAIHHAACLDRHLQFRHWIAWDALSEPRGKLMPAHYALLWYTKPGAPPVCNKLPAIDAPKYCLRAGCIKKRKAAGHDDKVEFTDVWWDIHRIRHKRDRDMHPCQLPERLMERIIQLTTNPGDVVFDPFCGTGTTAAVAKRLNRSFVVTDLDPEYIRITNERLAKDAPRASVARPRAAASKRDVELYLQELAQRLRRVPTEDEIAPEMLAKMDLLYPYRSAALKRCRIVL